MELKLNRNETCALAAVEPGKWGGQLTHGSVRLAPGVANRFGAREELLAWAVRGFAVDPDASSIGAGPWVPMCTYRRWPGMPYIRGYDSMRFQICGRLDEVGRVELAAFEWDGSDYKPWERVPAQRRESLGSVAEVDGTCSLGRLWHGDHVPVLRFASQEESEAMLLKDGKLKKSAAPRCVGVLMETGLVYWLYRVTETRRQVGADGSVISEEVMEPHTFRRRTTYYGPAWVYYAAIIDGVLYLAGVAQCLEPTRYGTVVVDTKIDRRFDEDGRMTVDYGTTRLPLGVACVTEDDLKTTGFSNSIYNPEEPVFPLPDQEIYDHMELLFGFRNGRLQAGFRTRPFTESMLLADRDDAGTVMARRSLARVDAGEDGGFRLTPLQHGDVRAGLTLTCPAGGVYRGQDGALQVLERFELSTQWREGEGFNAREEGTSMYIPYRTAGSGGYALCAWMDFTLARTGTNYALSGPVRAWGDGVIGELIPDSELYVTTIDCAVTTTRVVPAGGGAPDWPPLDPKPDREAEEDYDPDPPAGRLGNFYEYYMANSAAEYPVRMSSSLGDDDLASLISTAGPDVARQASFTFSLNPASRFFKTPSFYYLVEVTVGGSDGPYSWYGAAGKYCNVGSVTMAPSTLGANDYVAALTVAWAAPHDEVAADQVVTLTKRVPSLNKAGACRLAGATTVTAGEKLSGGNLITVEEMSTRTARYPERWYKVEWTEICDEVVVDPQTGREEKVSKSYSCRRWYDNKEAADAKAAALKPGRGERERSDVTRGPVIRYQVNPGWYLVRMMQVKVDLDALRAAMGWNLEPAPSVSGAISLSASSGDFYANARVSSVTKTLPE